MKPITHLLFSCCILSMISSCAQAPAKINKPMQPVVNIPAATEKKQFGGFSVTVPAGWQLAQAGGCSAISFISWDPQHPARQFFYQGTGGYFYLSAQQRQMDANYVAMGGMRTPLTDKPVISPLTPENFLRSYYMLAGYPDINQGIQKVPELYNVQIISSEPRPSGMPGAPATAALIRAIFTDRNKTMVSEGLFLVTTVPYIMNPMGGPGASFGVAYSFSGITAPISELDASLPALQKCLQAFEIDDNYAVNCMRATDQRTGIILKAGRTLMEGSDAMMKSWENRNRTMDIISQKRSDGIMGTQRLYDPSTGSVYKIDNTFLDKYQLEPGKYNLNNLRALPPDDHNLWTQPMLNGSDYIKRVN